MKMIIEKVENPSFEILIGKLVNVDDGYYENFSPYQFFYYERRLSIYRFMDEIDESRRD